MTTVLTNTICPVCGLSVPSLETARRPITVHHIGVGEVVFWVCGRACAATALPNASECERAARGNRKADDILPITLN